MPAFPPLHALDKQPAGVYRARRVALAAKLHGGVAVLFAAEEPLLDFMPYRQDSDFYYLTGWTEPGAALMIVARCAQAATPRSLQGDSVSARAQPAHGKVHRRQDGCSYARRGEAAGVDAVEPMTELPAELNRLIAADRALVEQSVDAAGFCRRPRRCLVSPPPRSGLDRCRSRMMSPA